MAASALGDGQRSGGPAQLTAQRELTVDGDVCQTRSIELPAGGEHRECQSGLEPGPTFRSDAGDQSAVIRR